MRSVLARLHETRSDEHANPANDAVRGDEVHERLAVLRAEPEIAPVLVRRELRIARRQVQIPTHGIEWGDALAAAEEVELNPLVVVYLNRLSDLLFILARAANPGTEVLWKPGSSL